MNRARRVRGVGEWVDPGAGDAGNHAANDLHVTAHEISRLERTSFDSIYYHSNNEK